MERERWLKIERLYHGALEREASARPEFLRVASIILVCPKCQHKRAGVADRGLLPNLSPPICNTLQ